jgi:pimeloyl-ACP methyl ester carboxylesterase
LCKSPHCLSSRVYESKNRAGLAGVGQQPDAPVVIVHGGLSAAVSWRRAAERLAERHEVLVPDRRGRGRGDDGDAPHSLHREVEDVESILDVAGPGAVLIGHSFGGALAAEAARRAQPGRLTAVVLYEPAIGVGGAITVEAIDRMQELIAAGERGAALEMGIAALDAAGLVSANPRPPGARWPDALLALAPTVPRELRAVTAPGLEPARYADLDLPVLVLAGTRSPKPQRRNCARLSKALPDGQLGWLEAIGHVAHTAAPDVFALAVSSFLRRAGQDSQAENSSSASGRT